MLEIYPMPPIFPIVKPKKIDKDDNPPRKQQRKNQLEPKKKNDAEPIQHIDEIV